MKVSDIAKKLNLSIKEIRDKATDLGFAISQKSNTMSDKKAKEFIDRVMAEKGISPQKKSEDIGVAEEVVSNIIQIPEILTVKELSEKMNLPVTKVITELMKNGVMASLNESIDFETAAIIGEILGFDIRHLEKETLIKRVNKFEGEKQLRPPVITIIGHVDHGKTSLIDHIRRTNVVASESGGITQHIGAYQVEKGKRKITILDTPGHEAFSAMREHGVRITDVAVLVVAADDGVKPQTIESINFAREAGVPLLVAINKIDKPGANIEKTKGELAELGLISEDWGGSTVMAHISAKTGQGIDELIDLVLLVADMKKIESYLDVPANGFVIESHLSTNQGPLTTVLVRDGILHVGDSFTVGSTVYGKIRSMVDFRGKKVKEARPSDPVQVSGLSMLPQYGDILEVTPDLNAAKEKVMKAAHDRSVKRINSVSGLAQASARIQSGEMKELKLIIKVDVAGSLQAIRDSLGKLQFEEVRIKIVNDGVGEINESDIKLASASGAYLVGFRVDVGVNAKNLLESNAITVETFTIIYELIDAVILAATGAMEAEVEEVQIGRGKVLKIFKDSKRDKIIGIRVEDGFFEREKKIIFTRNGEVVAEGKIITMKKGDDDIATAKKSTETGVRVMFKNQGVETDSSESRIVIKEDDQVVVYKSEKKKKELTRL
ncbi:MAG: translation initiation factor IF-2 [Patescibacteria group bacterium]